MAETEIRPFWLFWPIFSTFCLKFGVSEAETAIFPYFGRNISVLQKFGRTLDSGYFGVGPKVGVFCHGNASALSLCVNVMSVRPFFSVVLNRCENTRVVCLRSSRGIARMCKTRQEKLEPWVAQCNNFFLQPGINAA